MTYSGRAMYSTISRNGVLSLKLETVSIDEPGDDEVIVQVEAAPINPSDIGAMLGPADVSTLKASGRGDQSELTFDIPEGRLEKFRGRIDEPLALGNEGAGKVVVAGRNAKDLIGKRVGMFGGAMYADYRKINARDVIPLPDGVSAADGASIFVNPLTALGFVETARREGHKAIVHTAAASNLGQMLQKLCLAEGMPLVNIVRSDEQAGILRELGATHVLNSKDGDFSSKLLSAVEETGATIAFDAIGGGPLGGAILFAMERAAQNAMTSYNRYGSETFKQLYVYGSLNPEPVTYDLLSFGSQWSITRWLLLPFLSQVGEETAARLRQQVLDGLTTTFASRYTQVIGLGEALKPEILKAYEKRATGEKFLIDPTRS